MRISLAEKIKKYRQNRQLTQKELGILCGFPEKSADSRIREFESGKTQPKKETLQKIADALDVSILELLDITFGRPADFFYALFMLERQYGITPQESNDCPEDEIPLREMSHYWALVYEMFMVGRLSNEEYILRTKPIIDYFNNKIKK